MAKRVTLAAVQKAAAKVGGKVDPDGGGGYDLLAPPGKRWAWAETWCQPIPLGEAESPDDRAEMLQYAMDCCTGGFIDANDAPPPGPAPADPPAVKPPVGTRVRCYFGAGKYVGVVVKYGRTAPHVRFRLKNGKVKQGRATIVEKGKTAQTYRGYLAEMLT